MVNDILTQMAWYNSFIVLTSSLIPIPLMVSVLESEQHLSSGMSFVITQVTRSIVVEYKTETAVRVFVLQMCNKDEGYKC